MSKIKISAEMKRELKIANKAIKEAKPKAMIIMRAVATTLEGFMKDDTPFPEFKAYMDETYNSIAMEYFCKIISYREMKAKYKKVGDALICNVLAGLWKDPRFEPFHMAFVAWVYHSIRRNAILNGEKVSITAD